MNTEVLVAMITFLGSCVGTIGGILVSTKLVNYRLSLIERELAKQNLLVEKIPVIEEQVDVLKERLDELERKCA